MKMDCEPVWMLVRNVRIDEGGCMNHEKSCGAVVFTRRDGKILYVMAQMLGGHYGFPKGHMEPGETEEETALREIFEEVGLRPALLPGFREIEEYLLPNKPDTQKQVVYFLAEYENQTIRYQKEELRGAYLMTLEEALGVLQFEEAKNILRKADHFLHT